jgi:YD repeat-containing protein
VRFAYTDDLLAEVTDMAGQTFKYGYDADGLLTSLKRPNNLGGFDETVISYEGSYAGSFKATVTYPEGNQGSIEWQGYNTMQDTRNGLGSTVGTFETYSWGKTQTETKDSQGRIQRARLADESRGCDGTQYWLRI